MTRGQSGSDEERHTAKLTPDLERAKTPRAKNELDTIREDTSPRAATRETPPGQTTTNPRRLATRYHRRPPEDPKEEKKSLRSTDPQAPRSPKSHHHAARCHTTPEMRTKGGYLTTHAPPTRGTHRGQGKNALSRDPSTSGDRDTTGAKTVLKLHHTAMYAPDL